MLRGEVRAEPVLHGAFCKGCGRCVEACARGCIALGQEIHPESGLVPVALQLERCTRCGACLAACPEPYALVPSTAEVTPAAPLPSPREPHRPAAGLRVPLPNSSPLVMKGNHASAVGALLAGCRHFFGYPITPSTEGAEFMARALPALGGSFVQAVSEVAAVNMMYGCGGAGLPSMTFTSSPGFSLMLEGISYMIGAEVPGVFVNVMRAGPGLGNIAPEQSDIKLACRGLGHGNTHALVLAPASPQEMLDHTMLAFELAFRYRNPVVVAADGYLGQMTGKVLLPSQLARPEVPSWAVWGDEAHRRNLVTSIHLLETDLEAHNRHLLEKFADMVRDEQRADLVRCEDAELLLIACNTPARMAKGAIEVLRAEGIAAGLFRPQTLWPFPVKALLPLLERVHRVVVVEASDGQLEDELRLALSHAGAGGDLEISHVRRYGGMLPGRDEIVTAVRAALTHGEVAA